jgi:hypothetical protein
MCSEGGSDYRGRVCPTFFLAIAAIGVWFLTFWLWPGGEERARRLPPATLLGALGAVVAFLAAIFAIC